MGRLSPVHGDVRTEVDLMQFKEEVSPALSSKRQVRVASLAQMLDASEVEARFGLHSGLAAPACAS